MIHYTKGTPAFINMRKFDPSVFILIHNSCYVDRFKMYEYLTADCMRVYMINPRRVIFR